MHHISFSSGNSSFNYTTPVQEAQNRFASAPANSPPPATTTSIAQASEERQRPAAMPSMQAQLLRQWEGSPSHQSPQEGVRHSAATSSPTLPTEKLEAMLEESVKAQYLNIINQEGPSNSRPREAVSQLILRGCKPAVGGIEIPFTPNSLLGGGKGKTIDTTQPLASQMKDFNTRTLKALDKEIEKKEKFILSLREKDNVGVLTGVLNPTTRQLLQKEERECAQLKGEKARLSGGSTS